MNEKKFDLVEFQSNLKTKDIGQVFYYEEVVTSTMIIAEKIAEENAPTGSIVLTEMQTCGRGRGTRRWESKRSGNLYFTLVLRSKLAEDVAKLNFASALSLVHALGELGLETGVKWPNDIYIKGKKTAGILLDAKSQEGGIVVFLGIGVNVNQRLETFDEEMVKRSATSIVNELGYEVSRERVLASLCNKLEGLMQMEFERVLRDYKAINILLGKSIWVMPKIGPGLGRVQAVAMDVTEKGHLLVRMGGGEEKELVAEEVSVRETND